MQPSKTMPFTEGVGQGALGFTYKSEICKQNLAKLCFSHQRWQFFDLQLQGYATKIDHYFAAMQNQV